MPPAFLSSQSYFAARMRSNLPWIGIATFCLVGCTVVETTPLAFAPTQRCQSALGSYALPKTLIRIQVKGDGLEPTRAQTVVSALEEVTVPDATRTYCLDHLASGASADDISVVRGEPPGPAPLHRVTKTSTQLLTFISSHAVDYSADIIRRVIRTIFVAISGKPDFTPAARANLKITDAAALKYILADYSFDPFDLEAVARINRDLRPLGYCVLLETPYFDPAAGAAEQYCAKPNRLLRDGARFAHAYKAYDQAQDLPTSVPGIIYRPRMPYRLFLYANDDVAGGQTPWYLVRTMKVMLENASPVVSVGVQRSAFVARRTALLFDRGTLIGMCVSKNSEILAAVEIPLEIVRSIVALPSQILLIRIDNVTKTNELVQAETALINLQRQYIDFLADPKATRPADGRAADKTSGGYTGGPGNALATRDFLSATERKAPEFGGSLNSLCTAPAAAAIAAVGDQKG